MDVGYLIVARIEDNAPGAKLPALRAISDKRVVGIRR